MDQIRKSNAHKKPHFQDRITYLDAVQYEATLTPGVGKYNTRTRVLLFWFSLNQVISIQEKVTGLKNGVESIQRKIRKAKRRLNSQIWELITLRRWNHMRKKWQKMENGGRSTDLQIPNQVQELGQANISRWMIGKRKDQLVHQEFHIKAYITIDFPAPIALIQI